MATTEKMIQRIVEEAYRKSIFNGPTNDEKMNSAQDRKFYLKTAEVLKLIIK